MIFLDDDWTTRDQTVVQSHNTMKFFKSKKLPTISNIATIIWKLN